MFSVSLCFYYATPLQLDLRSRDRKTLDSPGHLGEMLNTNAGVNTRQKTHKKTTKKSQCVVSGCTILNPIASLNFADVFFCKQ